MCFITYFEVNNHHKVMDFRLGTLEDGCLVQISGAFHAVCIADPSVSCIGLWNLDWLALNPSLEWLMYKMVLRSGWNSSSRKGCFLHVIGSWLLIPSLY